MKFSVFQTSHQGGRQKNEDRMGYCFTQESALFVLADGMGGHPEGEIAAEIALQTMATLFKKQAQPTLENVGHFLESSLLTAHRQILRYAIDKAMPDSPRTTLVAAVIQNGYIQWIHCGDSRLYIARASTLVLRTRDHSYSELRDSILTKVGEMNRNVLFTCLGSPTRPIYDLSASTALSLGDRVLLCSDGLWGPLREEDIVTRLVSGPVDHAGPTLVDYAYAVAGKHSDNITLIAAQWEEEAQITIPAEEYYAYDEDFTSTITGDLLDDSAIEQSLDDINHALSKSKPGNTP